MSNFEDLTRIKVKETIQNGLKAQRYQRDLDAKTDVDSRSFLHKPLRWLALLVVFIRGI